MGSESGRRVVRNSLFGMAGLVLGALGQLAIVVVLTSLLPREGWGAYNSTVAFLMVVQLVAEMGVSTILTRKIATDRENAALHLGRAKALLWTFSTAVFALVAACALPLGVPRALYPAVLLACLATLVSLHSVLYVSVFRAHEAMGWNAAGFVLQKGAYLAAMALTVLLPGVEGLTVTGAFAGLLAANLANNAFYHAVLRRRFLSPRLHFDPAAWWELIRESAPLGAAALFRRFTWQVDRILLTLLATSEAVAIYSTAYQVNFFLNWIPFVVGVPLYPLLSRLAETDREELLRTYARAQKVLTVISLPTAACATVLAPRLVPLVFPRYPESVVPLQILIWAIVFAFLSSVYPYLTTALRQQRLFAVVAGCGLLFNAAVDLWAIPRFGYLGPCFATLGTEALIFFGGIALLRRSGVRVPYFPAALRPALASALVALGLWLARGAPLPVLLLAAAAAVPVYFALLLGTGAFTAEEREFVREIVRRRRRMREERAGGGSRPGEAPPPDLG